MFSTHYTNSKLKHKLVFSHSKSVPCRDKQKGQNRVGHTKHWIVHEGVSVGRRRKTVALRNLHFQPRHQWCTIVANKKRPIQETTYFSEDLPNQQPSWKHSWFQYSNWLHTFSPLLSITRENVTGHVTAVAHQTSRLAPTLAEKKKR